MEMEKKKSKIWLHVLGGFFLGVIICGGVGFFLYSQNYFEFGEKIANTKVNKEEKKEKQKVCDDCTDMIMTTLNFDSSKCINNSGASYKRLFPSDTGITTSLDSSQTKVTVAINHHLINTTYNLGWVTALEDYTYEPQVIEFNQKVNDIFIGGFGQDASGNTILFLMEDGTVQYIPLKKAFLTDHDHLKSYGTIEGVANIIKFYNVSASFGQTGGVTILAQKKDGTFYDLSTILQNTGNY